MDEIEIAMGSFIVSRCQPSVVFSQKRFSLGIPFVNTL